MSERHRMHGGKAFALLLLLAAFSAAVFLISLVSVIVGNEGLVAWALGLSLAFNGAIIALAFVMVADLKGEQEALPERSVGQEPDALALAPAAPEPDAAGQPPADERQEGAFSLEGFSEGLASSDDPIAFLKVFVGDIRTRQARAAQGVPDEGRGTAPCGIELYAARQLEEAGLFANDVELPRLGVIRPRRSGLFFVRIEAPRYPYAAKLRVIELEAALNRILFACAILSERGDASEEACFCANQSLEASVAAQAVVDILPEEEGQGLPEGEFALREALSTGIETFKLPYRLVASFRSNVAAGNLAVEIELVPAEAFPKSCFSADVGRIIPTTAEMRRRRAGDYALRVALLVTKQAFSCAPRLERVSVATVLDTSASHGCYLSAEVERDAFCEVDLAEASDPVGIWRGLGASLEVDDDGALSPVEQTFDLEDERFCPTLRYEPIELSSRTLEGASARAFGCERVSGLAIEEKARRRQIAADIGRHLGESTEANVRLILDLAGDSVDPSVQSAARRTVSKLIDGTLADQSPLAVEDEFVEGDELTRAVERAQAELRDKGRGPAVAARTLSDALAPLEFAGTYEDDGRTSYRHFSSYVERTLYNRMFAEPDKALELVPDAYFDATLLLATVSLDLRRLDDAMRYATRAHELDPLDDRSQLRIVRCYEYKEDYPSAIDQLIELLAIAHDAEGAGVAYYRMAFMQWKSGSVLAAQACYRKCLQFASSCYGLAAIELQTLLATTGTASALDDEGVDEALVMHGIPLAPTEQIGTALVECTRAALDSEVFPVARNFAATLGALTGDDVVFDIVRSIEHEPDR